MEWHQVGRKTFISFVARWDIFPYGGMHRGSSEKIDSIFFLDFPDRIRAKDIFELFDCHGDVTEVLISPWRNKFGRRFGFVRFIG